LCASSHIVKNGGKMLNN